MSFRRANLNRKWADPPGGHVHMQVKLLAGGAQVILLAMAQLLKHMGSFGVEPDQCQGDIDRIASRQFTQVRHMRLGGEKRGIGARQIVRPQAQLVKRLVDTPVEQNVIIGHVEMAVTIDPLRLDGHH